MTHPTAPRILIVDDEDSIRAVCRRVLTPEGYLIESAANAEEAVALLQAQSVRVVVTDLTMPGAMAGAGLLDYIHAQWPNIPVIIMTAYPDIDSAIGTLRAGAVDYLVKPFTQQQLKEAVAKAVSATRDARTPDPKATG